MTSKVYRKLRWQMVGMSIVFNALKNARNAGEPMNTLTSYVNENTGEPTASAPFPQSLLVMSHMLGLAESQAKVMDLEALLHIHIDPKFNRGMLELFWSQFD